MLSAARSSSSCSNNWSVCRKDAKIGFVFAQRGIVPEATSSYFLPRLIGHSRAMELFMVCSNSNSLRTQLTFPLNADCSSPTSISPVPLDPLLLSPSDSRSNSRSRPRPRPRNRRQLLRPLHRIDQRTSLARLLLARRTTSPRFSRNVRRWKFYRFEGGCFGVQGEEGGEVHCVDAG